MPSDLQVVAQYAKSRRDAPSEVYNAACRMLSGIATPLDATEGLREQIRRAVEEVECPHVDYRNVYDDCSGCVADAVLAGVVSPVLERLQAERDAARLFVAELQGLRDSLFIHLDSAEAERNALKAAIEQAKAEHTDDGTGACETCSNEDPTGLHDYREPMPCPTLRALGYPEKGAESHGGGRTPQTQGASEAQDAKKAQGGSDGRLA